MSSVKVKATIVEDNTGIKSQLPILITEQGEVGSVTDYLLKMEADGASNALMNGFIQATSLLLDYMEANKGLFEDPKMLFQTFAKRLYTGTMNPLRDATPHEQRLNYAAWYRKNQNDFLGHIEDKTVNKTIRKARTMKGRTPLTKAEDDALAFPDKHWESFYKDGIGGAKDPRVALRDKLMLLLMHGGGLRESEAIMLWVTDVLEDPYDPEKAIVRIYNEVDGKAPEGWRSRSGTKTREAYLQANE